ncbi:MAG: hypothetical protein L6420_00770 [Elusimicrobia bacterium]|nr:hypothetical protein [Elusimicrobiota bacterium]
MKKLSIFSVFALIFFLCARMEAFDVTQITSKSIILSKDDTKKIERGDIEIYIPIEGITTAQDTFDVLAPFDGRIEEIMAELFDLVDEKKILAKVGSSEMAAILDSNTAMSKGQMKRRWGDVFKLYDVKTKYRGIITNVYAKAKDTVNKGDRLFSIAKKVVIIGKNTKPAYCPLKKDLSATMKYFKDPSFKLETSLSKFIPLQPNSFYYRLWLDTGELKNKTKIGERFTGYLFVGRTEDARIVPTNALINIQNKKYLILEMKTGLATPESTELLGPGNQYIIPRNPESMPHTEK